MNPFKKITTGILTLAVAAGMASGVMAQVPDPIDDDGDVTVSITSNGVLSVGITDWKVGQLAYSLAPQYPNTTMTITVDDMRGNAGGWYVTLGAGDFTDLNDDTLTFDVENLRMMPGTVNHRGIPSGHATNAKPVVQGTSGVYASVTEAPQTVLVAAPGSGAGTFENLRPTQLTIPAGTLVGNYKSTVTVTIYGGTQP